MTLLFAALAELDDPLAELVESSLSQVLRWTPGARRSLDAFRAFLAGPC